MPTGMAILEKSAPLTPYKFEFGELRGDEVEIKVHSCGICHSDLSMIQNAWGMTAYPLVPGHEAVGEIVKKGPQVTHLQIGQIVGVGWYTGSCMTCAHCMSGDHNLCGQNEQTIVGRYGGFATHLRCRSMWAIPLPSGVDPEKAGPLFCGGITVFNPIIQAGVLPTDRVGVVGIGGLGHLALQYLNAWGCEVTAFSSTKGKSTELKNLGAHHIVDSRDPKALSAIAGTLDFILVTVNVPIAWELYYAALKPRGRLHVVGAVLEPIPSSAFTLLGQQKSLSGSPLGSPATTAKMLEFSARHNIAPVTETFPMSKVNEALEHLEKGSARYRIVLKNDL